MKKMRRKGRKGRKGRKMRSVESSCCYLKGMLMLLVEEEEGRRC